MGKFGYEGTDYSKEQYLAWKGKRKRTDGHETDYLKGNDIINKMNDPYLNVGYEREHYGGVKIKAAGSADGGKNMQFSEEWDHAGGRQVLPDGSVGKWCGGTVNEYSGSKISTNIGPSCGINGNHVASRSGNGDNQDYAKSGARMHAGSHYNEVGNDQMGFNGGKNMQVSARSKYGGIVGVGSHGMSTDCGGKADYGHGSSVHNGDEWQSVMCQMGDGSVYIAVGQVQAASAPKGIYTLKIDKQGNMTIKTGGSITVESAGTHTIKAPKIELDTPMVHTTGKVNSDDDHTAPNFHGCADYAHGSC